MEGMGAVLERWDMDEVEVRRRMYRAPTPRERERWHALVVHQFWIDGYKDFNFMRASAVVKRQSTFMAS